MSFRIAGVVSRVEVFACQFIRNLIRPVEGGDAEGLEEHEGRRKGPVGRPAQSHDLLRPEEDLKIIDFDI